jgi:hypothetical protein
MPPYPTSLRKTLLTLVTTLAGAVPYLANAQSYSVPGITLTKQSSSASSIVFKGTATCSTISGFELSTPRRFVVDCMYPTNGSGKARTREFGLTSSLVSGIRYGSHQDKLRLVFDIGAGASKVTFGKAGGKSFLVSVTGDNTQEFKPIKKAAKATPTKPTAKPTKEKIATTPTPTPTPVTEQPTPEPIKELPWVPSGSEFVSPPSESQTPLPTPSFESATVAPTPVNTAETATPTQQPTVAPTVAPTIDIPPIPIATPTPTAVATPISTPTLAPTPVEIVREDPKNDIPTEIPTPPPASSKDRNEDDSMQSELSAQGYHIIKEDLHSDRKLGNIIFDYLPPLSVPVIRLIFSSPAEFRMSKKGESEYILTIPDCTLSGVETALPYFPPEDFTGFSFVQASDDKKGCKVRIGSERGYRISPYIKEREIQIRLTVN